MYGDPFGQMRRLQEDVNHLFQAASGAPGTLGAGFPAMNIYASQDGVTVTAEVPGVSSDALDITVHRDTLTLSGERPGGAEDAKGYHRRERGRGRFARTVSLPFQVDPDQVEARLADGVLTLHLRRPEEDKPRRIAINAG